MTYAEALSAPYNVVSETTFTAFFRARAESKNNPEMIVQDVAQKIERDSGEMLCYHRLRQLTVSDFENTVLASEMAGEDLSGYEKYYEEDTESIDYGDLIYESTYLSPEDKNEGIYYFRKTKFIFSDFIKGQREEYKDILGFCIDEDNLKEFAQSNIPHTFPKNVTHGLELQLYALTGRTDRAEAFLSSAKTLVSCYDIACSYWTGEVVWQYDNPGK